MRSSRRTTGEVAENSVVDDATDACSLRRIFATFLANSSTSLSRAYFYLISPMAGKAFAYSPDCQSRIIANYSFKVSLSESGITKTAPDQLGWIGMNGIYVWGGLNYEGTFMESGGMLN
jgi:hypothetical protein